MKKSKQLLLIDDEPHTIKSFMTQLVDKHNCLVDVARNVTEGVARLSEKCYDLLILDIMLPHDAELDESVPPTRSGLALIPLIRRGDVGGHDVSRNSRIPMLVLTAVSDQAALKHLRSLNPCGILRKPVSYQEFLKAVTEAR